MKTRPGGKAEEPTCSRTLTVAAALILVLSISAQSDTTAATPDEGGSYGAGPGQAFSARIRRRLRVSDFALQNVIMPQEQLPDYLTVTVEHEGLPQVLHLFKWSVRGPNFHVQAQRPGGKLVRIDPGPVRTYQGFVESEPGGVVSATVGSNGLRARVLRDRASGWRIEPLEGAELSEMLQTARSGPGRVHILYSESDIEPSDLLFSHPPLPPPGPGEPPLASFSGLQTAGALSASSAIGAAATGSFAWYGCDVMRAEIGLDVDYTFYASYASSDESTAVSLIEGLVNDQFNTRFIRDTLIEHVIGKVIIRTDSAADPYATTNMNDQLTTLRSLWNNLPANERTHDLAQLQTGQRTNYGGLAWVKQICTSYRYSVASRAFGASFWGGAALHEIAHNWGLGHSHRGCPERRVGVMCGDNSRMHVLEVDTIIRYRNSRSCLENIGPYPTAITPYAGMDLVNIFRGGASAAVDVLANDHDANCDTLTIAHFQSTSELGGAVTRSVGAGPGGRDQLVYTPPGNTYGQDWFKYTIGDGTGLQATGNVKIIVKLVDSMQGYWKLDETTGETAADSSGNAYDGTLEGTFTFDAASMPGLLAGALSFNGDDDYIEVPAMYLNSNTVTITAWVKRDGSQNNWAAILFSRSESTVAGLTFGTDNEIRYNWNDTGYNWNSGITIPDNQWTFVALVIEPEKATFYSTGARDLRSATHYAVHDIEQFDGRTRIGDDLAGGNRHFRGALDDVRIYNYALNAPAIYTVYAGGRAENPRPFDSQQDVAQRATLSWASGGTAIGHDVYFGTSYEAVANATTASPEYRGRISENSYIPFMEFNTRYFWRIDEITAAPGVVTGAVWSFTTGAYPGTITREVWTEIGGSAVSDLATNRLYPGRPDIREEITSFEGPVDWADNYGTRIHGFLVPAKTGSYTFWIAGDDNCELWLSADDKPANLAKIAEVPGWSNSREWGKFPEQKSGAITLTAGKYYYIVALHKEASGDDNIGVAWKGPDIDRQIIPGRHLAPYDSDSPAPNPMTWATTPHRTSSRSIAMAASTATDRSGVEYYFTCTSGNGHDSGWQPDPLYQDTGLSPNTLYSYTVVARDKSNNRNTTLPSPPHSTRTALLGDFEPDGDVDLADLARFADYWPDAGPIVVNGGAVADLDGDGDADFADLAALLLNWLATQP